uniref:Uncharacterized protein n=2 Tax=Nothobranchius furzeri TaxID=105023 RepID=A0A8C6NTV4_NOTFU
IDKENKNIPVFCEDWKASVVPSLEALVSSCVVVPYSGIWYRNQQKEETILGDLGQNNPRLALHPSLEIMAVRDHDNGPFCFRIEMVKKDDNKPTEQKFSSVESCVHMNKLNDPPEPDLSHSKMASKGKPHLITCSVRHTFPSLMSTITWTHIVILSGTTEISSIKRNPCFIRHGLTDESC